MAKQHTWKNKDSLSSLAAANGLATWERIWDDPANATLREDRGSPENIREGDIITIPDKRLGEVSRPTEVRHPFVRIGVPPASIKIISDGGNPQVAVSTEQRILQISTLVTTSRLPTGFLTASTDARNFKIEVFDEGATGQTINCEIEAQKPLLDARGRPQRDGEGKLTYENFATRRRIATVPLRRVPGLNHIYRSRYLRLVTTPKDDTEASRVNQTLLVDHDPNDLNVEILDQQVVARYTAVSGEPLATEAVVGDSEKRVRCKIFVCRTAFDNTNTRTDNLVGGVTLADVKLHMQSWSRRIYAQANMSPLLVDGEVVAVNPVENMIAVSQLNRNNARGNREVRFRVNTAPNPTMISLNTVAGETPLALANRLATAARAALPAGFTVEVFTNPLAFNRIIIADIIIKNGNERVIIDQERSQDSRIRVVVGRTRINSTTTAPANLYNVGIAENRVLIRNYRTDTPAHQGSIAIFVINRFDTAGLSGFAYGKQFREVADIQGQFPVAGSCFVIARSVSTANRGIQVLTHEMGHILCDMFHFNAPATELMFKFQEMFADSIWNTRRISDRVLAYREEVTGPNSNFPINPNSEIRTREARFIEGWNVLLRRP